MLLSRKLVLALGVALAACSSDPPTTSGPCGRGELSACGTSCTGLSTCPVGLFCAAGACDAQCTAASAATDCSSGQTCGSDGRCSGGPAADAAEPEADSASPGGLDGGGVGGADGSVEVCGRVTLDTTPKTPNVMLIIDQSSSMDEPFGDQGFDRWTSLKNSLLAADGLIAELEGSVRFGATFYSASNGQEIMPPPMECPVLTEVGIALDNFDMIRDAYPPTWIEDTPTGDAIQAVLAKLQGGAVLDPQGSDPTIFILATDGEPDTCAELDPQNGQEEAIDAVEQAFSAGIRTYVIAVADEGNISQEHLNDLANAGVGNAGGPQAPSYRPDDDQGLRQALREIVEGVVSCDVVLEGTVTGEACDAEVRIGDTRLNCNDANGFELVNPSLVRLSGSACEELKAGKQLTATFPCGGAVPI